MNAIATESATAPTQYLTFMLGSDAYALGILSIKEIIEYTTMTEVPLMPACVRGVINLRGAVVPVMDLQVRFGQPVSPVTKRTCIVIAPPAFGARIRADFMAGMGKVRGKFVILLNVDRVLDLDDLQALSQASSAAAAAQVG